MATEDEVKLPSKEELLGIIDEGTEESQTETPKFNERETHAMSYGWMPKDQWIEKGGDPEEWRPARDFLERGEMIGKIRALTKEQQDNQAAIRHIANENKKIYQTGYTQAIADLKAERKVALQDGDLVRADEIAEKIDSAKEALEKTVAKQDVPRSQQVDPEHLQWVEQNQWYTNPVMMKFADALAIEYVRLNGASATPADVRDYVSKTVKKEFKHRFEENQVRSAPNPDGQGSRGNTGVKSQGSSNLSKIEADMPEEHRKIMQTMLKADKDFKKEDYLKMYNSGR